MNTDSENMSDFKTIKTLFKDSYLGWDKSSLEVLQSLCFL